MTNVLITGAAGNLGSLLSRHIRDHEKDLNLILMQHLKKIPDDIKECPRFQVRSADLSNHETLYECLDGADMIVHFAGVLFKANPEKFLYETNVRYFENLVKAAKEKKISRIITQLYLNLRNSPVVRLSSTPVSMSEANPLSAPLKMLTNAL